MIMMQRKFFPLPNLGSKKNFCQKIALFVKLSCCKGNEPDCNKVAVVKILEKLLKMPVFDNIGVYFCG